MEDYTKHVLGLQLPTDPRWADIAEKNLEDILVDHAYCEQKAASACISLIIRFPDKEKLVDMLTPVVAEEWGHFERVLEQLRKRGLRLGHKRKDEYVAQLTKIVRVGGSKSQQLLDQLLFCALIEARSCERFKMLWKNIADPELQQFYYELMVSEAGHYKNFIQLAKEYIPAEEVEERWREMLKAEADIIRSLEVRPDRMH